MQKTLAAGVPVLASVSAPSSLAVQLARELGLSENAVYIAKSRVLRRLRQELEGLMD